MATNGRIKMVDRMAAWVESKLDITALLRGYFPDYIPPDSNVMCPFHEDTKPSLHISATGACYCHGCQWQCRNVIELFAKMEDTSYQEARTLLYEELVDAVPEAQVQTCVRALWKRKRPIQYLKRRGLMEETIQKFELGYEVSSDRIVIPVRDQFGTCVNLRRFAWQEGQKYKVLNLKGRGEVRLYPEPYMVKESRVLLVEGEWDALIGRQCGIPAVTWTGGATSWNQEHQWLFRDKLVFVLYDNDKAGRDGTARVVSLLIPLSSHVEQLDPLMKKGKDLTDWYKKDQQRVLFLAGDIESYQFTQPRGRCPYCGREY